MPFLDSILGRETRASLEARVSVAHQSEQEWKRKLRASQADNARLSAALDLAISEGHFRNNDGRLLGKGKVPSDLREKLGLD